MSLSVLPLNTENIKLVTLSSTMYNALQLLIGEAEVGNVDGVYMATDGYGNLLNVYVEVAKAPSHLQYSRLATLLHSARSTKRTDGPSADFDLPYPNDDVSQ